MCRIDGAAGLVSAGDDRTARGANVAFVGQQGLVPAASLVLWEACGLSAALALTPERAEDRCKRLSDTRAQRLYAGAANTRR